MSEQVPEPVRGFIDAVNAGDTERFLAYFPENGVVDDWGRQFRGRDEIRGWSDREFLGAKGTLTPTAVLSDGDTVTVDGHWASNHFTGDSRFVFSVENDAVREMRITDS